MELSFTTRRLGDDTVLAVVGDVDLATVPRLRSQVIDLVAEGCRSLVIDFSAVDFVDSAGLGALIGARRRLRAVGGDVSLAVPAGPLRDLISIAGLAAIFSVLDPSDLRCPIGR